MKKRGPKKLARETEKTYSVDAMMLNMASSLIRDFQTNLNDPLFCCDRLALLRASDIAGVRRLESTLDETLSVAEYKATLQVESILKRYRFTNDLYSDQELEKLAEAGFLGTQDRLRGYTDLYALPAETQRVLIGARIYIAKVLGEYSDEEHRSLCRFGSGASVGVPAAKACEGERWQLPLSGSLDQIAWFDEGIRQIDSVQDYWAGQRAAGYNGPTYQPTRHLKLTLVPKSFKALRVIMPNTTIGSYMSQGLGEMIRKRLKREGLDIARLQMRHRVLARDASVHSLYTTADLSSASDTISVALVKFLLPPDWYDILVRARIGGVSISGGLSIESLTFCTMGIGYTFTLQTLVFLALLKAIQAIMYDRKDRRCISVYGDDLIYSSRMHSEVVRHFEQIGFVINLDKTFHEGHFRESCGGDYYRGVDVRPFQPKNGDSAQLCAKAYEAMLYKCVNGLLARWDEQSVERTLAFLTSELEFVAGSIKLVPCDYPADSGVKCPTLAFWNFLRTCRVERPVHIGHGVFRFSYLALKAKLRVEVRHEPYYWLALDGVDLSAFRPADGFNPKSIPSLALQCISLVTRVGEEKPQVLIQRDKRPAEFIRSFTGKRLRRTETCVSIAHSGRYKRQSGTSCFEDRRGNACF